MILQLTPIVTREPLKNICLKKFAFEIVKLSFGVSITQRHDFYINIYYNNHNAFASRKVVMFKIHIF